MAVITNSDSVDDKNLIKKQNCEANDLQVNKHENSEKNTVSNITKAVDSSLSGEVKSFDSSSVSGKVHVTNSSKVTIGNNTYFNGPVRIKRIKQKVPAIKSSSKKNDGSDVQTTQKIRELSINSSDDILHTRGWHIISPGVLYSIVLSGIVAILFNIIILNHHSSSSHIHQASIETGYAKLLRMCYENSKIIYIMIALIPLVVLLKSLLRFSYRHNKNKNVTDEIEEVYDTFMRPAKKVNTAVITPEGLRMVSRTVWHAQPVVIELERLRQPVPWVIISHTATASCSTQSECVRHIRVIQQFHKESKDWDDIGYNFLVGGDGSAYCGRGWDNIGAHTLGYNKYSIGISFIGTFIHNPPPKRQLDACKKLLKRGVAIGKLTADYKLFAHRQLWATLSPGDKLYDIIKEWPHFVKNINDISELIPDY